MGLEEGSSFSIAVCYVTSFSTATDEDELAPCFVGLLGIAQEFGSAILSSANR